MITCLSNSRLRASLISLIPWICPAESALCYAKEDLKILQLPLNMLSQNRRRTHQRQLHSYKGYTRLICLAKLEFWPDAMQELFLPIKPQFSESLITWLSWSMVTSQSALPRYTYLLLHLATHLWSVNLFSPTQQYWLITWLSTRSHPALGLKPDLCFSLN